MQMSLWQPGLKCSFSVFLLFTPLYQWQSFLPFPAPLPVRGLNVMPCTANYHFGFLHWCHLGLREEGATYPSAQQEMGHQSQEQWGCSMHLAWKRLEEGTQLLLLCLLHTLKKKKKSSQHHAGLPQTHTAYGWNLRITNTGDSPAGDNWTYEITRTNLNLSKPQKALRGV